MLCFWFHTICDDSNCAIRCSVAVNLKRHYFAFVLIVNPPTELTRSLSETSPLTYASKSWRLGVIVYMRSREKQQIKGESISDHSFYASVISRRRRIVLEEKAKGLDQHLLLGIG
jgi:hypothetical protein